MSFQTEYRSTSGLFCPVFEWSKEKWQQKRTALEA
jgi:hypothetical protein